MKKFVYITYDNNVYELVNEQVSSTYDGGYVELSQEEFEAYERITREWEDMQELIYQRAKPNK